MADVKLLAPKILHWEGETFTNNPNDAGGATKDGVTFQTFNAWFKVKFGKDATIEDLKAITHEVFAEVLKEDYWDRWQADKIVSQDVANIVVDFLWGSGTWGIKIPQRLLGLPADGVVGPATLAALNATDPKEFVTRVADARINFYRSIVAQHPNWSEFLQGWINRANFYRIK